MDELLGGMPQTDFNQQTSTTTEEAVHARKARSVREASADVATPVRTSARNNGENEATPSTIPTPKTAQDNGKAPPATPGTRGRASNPTPKALFTRAQKHNKPRAKRSSWDTGPPPAATDAHRPHRRTRQEWAHQVAGRVDRGSGCHGCGTAPSREGHSPDARTSRYDRGADHRPGSSWRTAV